MQFMLKSSVDIIYIILYNYTCNKLLSELMVYINQIFIII